MSFRNIPFRNQGYGWGSGWGLGDYGSQNGWLFNGIEPGFFGPGYCRCFAKGRNECDGKCNKRNDWGFKYWKHRGEWLANGGWLCKKERVPFGNNNTWRNFTHDVKHDHHDCIPGVWFNPSAFDTSYKTFFGICNNSCHCLKLKLKDTKKHQCESILAPFQTYSLPLWFSENCPTKYKIVDHEDKKIASFWLDTNGNIFGLENKSHCPTVTLNGFNFANYPKNQRVFVDGSSTGYYTVGQDWRVPGMNRALFIQ
jgi:hypothetical protein